MDKKQKIILIAIGIVTIISIILAIFIIICIPSLEGKQEEEHEYFQIEEIEEVSTIQEVSVRTNFYAVETCINKFYLCYTELFDEEENSPEAVYSMLDDEYINEKGITQDNLKSKLVKMPYSIIDITNMYVSAKSKNISVYLAKGTLREIETGELSSFQIMIKLDSTNKTFKVLLQDYVSKKYDNFKIGEDITIDVPDNIERNAYNVFEYKIISDQDYVVDLFDKYKKELLYNKELAYNLLDEDYRQKKFGTLEKFKTIAKKNTSNNVIAKIERYKKVNMGSYTQYICIDQKGNYYIFKETAPMQYTVILDTYTIDLPEFTTKYNSASDENKVLMNIQRVFDAINDGDYGYAYNKLDSTFRNNNFKTQEHFENYVKNSFFEKNKLASGNAEKQGDVYLYNIIISDASGKNTNTVSKNFVMQLKEGTDFVMSFSVD